jgi:hypothetical protein
MMTHAIRYSVPLAGIRIATAVIEGRSSARPTCGMMTHIGRNETPVRRGVGCARGDDSQPLRLRFDPRIDHVEFMVVNWH